eukprot:TRINITY_DN1839_c0_g1_i1.p1 TRINITY_DN1839_c0_g1~~TRINITY_DN1839_c0_g1_i1.p1  ORF type:complete len:486 (+),score=145.64 TRINITY_DN1839_c0_g1_i1:33-1490(+)
MFGNFFGGNQQPQQQQQQMGFNMGFGQPQQQQQMGFGMNQQPQQQQQMGFGMNQQPQQPQQPQQNSGFGAMMGNMMGNLFGGITGGSNQQSNQSAQSEDFGPLTPGQTPSEIPQIPLMWEADVVMEMPLMPMPMQGHIYHDFVNQRERFDGYGMIDYKFFGLKKEVKMPMKEIEDLDNEMGSYAIPPFAEFKGYQTCRGIECQVWYFDFFSMLPTTIHVNATMGQDGKMEYKLVHSYTRFLGMDTNMKFSNFVGRYLEDSLFQLPFPIVPPPAVVQNFFIYDATNKKPINGTFSIQGNNNNYMTQEQKNFTKGECKVQIPLGVFDINVMADGYMPYIQRIELASPKATTIFMCPIMQPNQKRIVLSWGVCPRDLDLYVRDMGTNELVYYKSRHASNLHLDIDVTSGCGPETVTLTNCMNPVKISVHQFSSDGSIVGSGATITIFGAQGIEHVIPFDQHPVLVEGNRWWPVAFYNPQTSEINLRSE